LVVKGCSLGPQHKSVGLTENLVYLVVACPGLVSSGTAESSKGDTVVNVFTYTRKTPSGSVPISLKWDRRDDIVTMGGQRFGRETGNVFTVRREMNGQIISRQVSSLGPNADFPSLLRHVREQLPNDKIIDSLRIR
jgi:hypothetical protein